MFKRFSRNRVAQVFLVFFLVFIGLVISRIPVVMKRQKAQETVSFIEAQKLTMGDVRGDNLPPTPDPNLVDATIEGVDVNGNYIRDDVELAIFEKYPDDMKVRAAELQYAMALQLYLTKVVDTTTWVAGARQTGRGFGCIFETIPDVSLYMSDKEASEIFKIADVRIEDVEQLVLNTSKRMDYYKKVDGYITTYSSSSEEDCDLKF